MNYNMKCDIERARGVYVGNVELSGVGRSGQKRVTDENFDAFLVKLKAAHDELLANVETYFKASEPTAPITHPSEAPAPAKVARSKGKAIAPGKPSAKKATYNKKAAAAKSKPRKFAAE